MLYTANLLAILIIISGVDYSSTSVDLTFNPVSTDSTSCETIQLLLDTDIEEGERFFVEISSTDENVNILSQSASVVIQDESTVDITFTSDVYPVREDDGIVEVCAELGGGTLQRDIRIEFATQDSTATGTLYLHAQSVIIMAMNLVHSPII